MPYTRGDSFSEPTPGSNTSLATAGAGNAKHIAHHANLGDGIETLDAALAAVEAGGAGYTDVNVTEVGTGAATSETDLQQIAVAADTLPADGVLEVVAAGTMSGIAGSRTPRLYIGTVAVASFTIAAPTASVDWQFKALVFADGSQTAQKVTVSVLATAEGQSITDYLAETQDFSGAVTIKTTGQTSNAGDEITSEVLLVRRIA